MALRIAIVVPPTVDLNTPYASAPRLAGWLRSLGHEVVPLDLSIALFHKIFSRRGLERIFAATDPARLKPDSEDVYRDRDRYIRTIDDVIAYARGTDLTAVNRIISGQFLPEGQHFRVDSRATRRRAFGEWGQADHARYLCGLLVMDIAAFIRDTISTHYYLTSYAEKLTEDAPSFDVIEAALESTSIISTLHDEVIAELVPRDVELVCATCPFPGNLLGALQLGRWLARHMPGCRRALGGGYPSTCLRELDEPRVFDYMDYVVLDDGEVPLRQICARIAGSTDELHNTFTREHGRVVFHPPTQGSVPFAELPAPDYRDFPLDRYVDFIYRRNHVSRLLSVGRWLKITAAHGCYWKQCTFCDIHLPYINDYDPIPARELADQMDAMHAQTGLSGFHFTDEAAPPNLLVNLALELLRRGRTYQFWGNARYDKAFTPDRCRLLAAAGMVAITGGIEVASDDLLPVISKGVSVRQLVKVLQAFAGAGIRTHGYLIHGFPRETPQSTVNSLEILRQLSHADILHSGFFHALSVTAHAPLGRDPSRFGIKILGPEFKGFARYSLEFEVDDGVRRRQEIFERLQMAVAAFARGEQLERPVADWLPDMPRTTIAPTFVRDVMAEPHPGADKTRVCWLGGTPQWSRGMLTVTGEHGETYTAQAPKDVAELIARCQPSNWSHTKPPSLADIGGQEEWLSSLRPVGFVVV